jgi:hypothetical protein
VVEAAVTATYRYPLPRRYRRARYPYRFRRDSGGALPAALVAGAVLLAGAGAAAKAATAPHGTAPAGKAGGAPPVTRGSEAAFYTAALTDLGAPATTANISSLAAWGAREGCWGCVGRYNQLDSTLYEPGATAFNTFSGSLHVWNYPDAAEGAQATAATISGYPGITAALRSGGGLCGGSLAAEFSRWSGGGYQEVC